ncbi:MAG: hypothetical protein HZA61_09190 [Candidatus Eisenbacteria bacterium]|uniref:Uncharacterized protein n=1 Tax=Eiseniibacteriota bacterium TaxID=2212470 RepID=A0A933WAU6_UNCEI|nr:hypothetical protein [Candidatus Eisenbacteria bacterium]
MNGRLNGTGMRTPRAISLAGLSLCVAALAVLAALCGCGVNDVRVTVANASGRPLDSLVVAGEGFAKRVRPLAPGESAQVRVAVNGEDALALRGRIGGRPLVPQMAAYVEAGYSLRFEVDSGGVTHAEPRAAY